MDGALEPGLYEEGDEVRTSDDYRLGEVIGVLPEVDEPRTLIVAASPEADARWYVPVSAVAGFQPGHLYLGATRDEVRALGWDAPPVDAG